MTFHLRLRKGFFRIKLLQVELQNDQTNGDPGDVTDTVCIISLKEEIPRDTVLSSINRKVNYQEWNSYFDIQLPNGSHLEITVVRRPLQYLASLLLTSEDLDALCPENNLITTWVELKPSGRLNIQVRFFKDEELSVPLWGEEQKMNPMTASGIRRRRGAIKLQKIHEANGHRFNAKFFCQPTFCAFCHEFLWEVFLKSFRMKFVFVRFSAFADLMPCSYSSSRIGD